MDRRQAPSSAHAAKGGQRAPQRDDSNRLVRLIEELRALDLERRRQPVSSKAFRDLAKRMESKAREVFDAATGPLTRSDDEEGDRSNRPPSH
jgi:hypothetical protein